METTQTQITLLAWEGGSVSFELKAPGFSGNFRIVYDDNTRKNARYKSYAAIWVYFNGLIHSDSVEACNATDAILFVERKKQWILEYLIRESKS